MTHSYLSLHDSSDVTPASVATKVAGRGRKTVVPLKTPDDLAPSFHLTPDFFAVTPVVVCIARISYLGPDTCD